MSIMARRGKCPTCGHDFGNDPLEEFIKLRQQSKRKTCTEKRISELTAEVESLKAKLVEEREKHQRMEELLEQRAIAAEAENATLRVDAGPFKTFCA